MRIVILRHESYFIRSPMYQVRLKAVTVEIIGIYSRHIDKPKKNAYYGTFK